MGEPASAEESPASDANQLWTPDQAQGGPKDKPTLWTPGMD
ncbi:MAG: hypothetical protein N2C14_34200 [Planctomycetales bacterium]